MAQPERRDWFRIVNKADDDGNTAYIEIFDVIGYDPWWDEGVSASKFIDELREITAPNIELHINSPGGDVYEGIAIYNALRDHPVGFQKSVWACDQLGSAARHDRGRVSTAALPDL